MKKLIIFLLSTFISFNVLSTDIDYIHYKKDPSRFDDYVRGLESGVSWSYLYSLENGSAVKVYCQPESLILTLENTHNIIQNGTKYFMDKQGNTQSEVDEMSVGMIYLFGLMTTFPCN